MKQTLLYLSGFFSAVTALTLPLDTLQSNPHLTPLKPRQGCENTPTSRECWGDFNLDTNYYTTWPETGETKEYWLSVQAGNCAPDGYRRTCMTFNGTIPGPTIIADWGDNLVIHVTNNMRDNGTSIHWHGLHMRNNSLNDGVPGVTQCGIPPGETQTYRFKVSQYGSTWYHSHFSLQYAEGLFGGMIFNGPATADYDVDLGPLFLSDWGHTEGFHLWSTTAKQGIPPSLDSGLINGTNTWTCDPATDNRCDGTGGKKHEIIFEPNTKYLIRLVNPAIDAVWDFSIDKHTLTVIAQDLVAIKPYTTDSVQISMGQRYDVIVEAKPTEATADGNYWLRAGFIGRCAPNVNPLNITGIVRYNADSTAEPTSTSDNVLADSCNGEPLASLIPRLELDVENIFNTTLENVRTRPKGVDGAEWFQWTLNSSSLHLDWSDPTLAMVFRNETLFPTPYNVVGVQPSNSGEREWQVLVIQDATGFGISHPIHLHGHDFWILAAEPSVTFNGDTSKFNTKNPSRRDVGVLPGNGYLAIAFELDNPGAWLVHCHIAWHASQGLSLEFVESQDRIEAGLQQQDKDEMARICRAWQNWPQVHPQEDSGI
ncbi:multicopper oxidase-domain-containing protein [Triangularia verruculosa]|uniref:Multicopper oxidase-domain-containing protein n=1 Tax=Triangularia verruculosa TaxID=2587418 RepID=A0AAN7AP89_9PEZI|nr:multicopper oxidase-domain-containing protein [Triangularia verruculosa]